MALRASWMPILVEKVNWGCKTSRLLEGIYAEDAVAGGRNVCLTLWPLIKDLPVNIQSVRDSLPESMDSAYKLLSQLSDDERFYQRLYIKQCNLSGLTDLELDNHQAIGPMKALCEAMRYYCRELTYKEGILAVVTAELAATAISRIALPVFERHFEGKGLSLDSDDVREGLEWLRLHARPQTRHALWLTRMLSDIDCEEGQLLPEPAHVILSAFYRVWECPNQEISNSDRIAEGVL